MCLRSMDMIVEASNICVPFFSYHSLILHNVHNIGFKKLKLQQISKNDVNSDKRKTTSIFVFSLMASENIDFLPNIWLIIEIFKVP